MADTARTLSALQTLLADNSSGDISAQDVRDFLVSVYASVPSWADRIEHTAPTWYWKLDETSGTTANESIGGVNDSTYAGASPTLNATGINPDGDGCPDFNGSDDIVNLPGDINFKNWGDAIGFTIGLWFNADSLSGVQQLFEQGGVTTGVGIQLDGTTLYAYGWSGGSAEVATSVASLSASTTYFVVGVFDKVGKIIRLYLDGVHEDSQGASTQGADWGGGDDGGIGGVNGSARDYDGTSTTTNFYDGRISSVAVWSRVLPGWEVKYLYDGYAPFSFGTAS